MRALLTLNNVRSEPITNGYRCDWRREGCLLIGCMSIISSSPIAPSSKDIEVELIPLNENIWKGLRPGSVLYALEGPIEIGSARII